MVLLFNCEFRESLILSKEEGKLTIYCCTAAASNF
jgi:hypothetical protein